MRVRVLFDYAPREEGELCKYGVLVVKDAPIDGWWYAVAADGHAGVFPHNYAARVVLLRRPDRRQTQENLGRTQGCGYCQTHHKIGGRKKNGWIVVSASGLGN